MIYFRVISTRNVQILRSQIPKRPIYCATTGDLPAGIAFTPKTTLKPTRAGRHATSLCGRPQCRGTGGKQWGPKVHFPPLAGLGVYVTSRRLNASKPARFRAIRPAEPRSGPAISTKQPPRRALLKDAAFSRAGMENVFQPGRILKQSERPENAARRGGAVDNQRGARAAGAAAAPSNLALSPACTFLERRRRILPD